MALFVKSEKLSHIPAHIFIAISPEQPVVSSVKFVEISCGWQRSGGSNDNGDGDDINRLGSLAGTVTVVLTASVDRGPVSSSSSSSFLDLQPLGFILLGTGALTLSPPPPKSTRVELSATVPILGFADASEATKRRRMSLIDDIPLFSRCEWRDLTTTV